MKLSGAVYRVTAESAIYTPDGALMYQKADVVADGLTTGDSGEVMLNNVPLGSYVVEETQAPAGFVLSGEKHTVKLEYAGQDAEVAFNETIFTNERQKVAITIHKQDGETKNRQEPGKGQARPQSREGGGGHGSADQGTDCLHSEGHPGTGRFQGALPDCVAGLYQHAARGGIGADVGEHQLRDPHDRDQTGRRSSCQCRCDQGDEKRVQRQALPDVRPALQHPAGLQEAEGLRDFQGGRLAGLPGDVSQAVGFPEVSYRAVRDDGQLPDDLRNHDGGVGGDIKTTQALMGHSTPEMTLKVYAKKEESRLPDAVRKMETFLAGGTAF